ncbi:MAG: hypothetical protein GY868_08355 [Deltaproteobacteria bacterium]|nr:hypothetical protein [Deltaproteobacteria bacterium]
MQHLLSDKLIKLVEQNSATIIERWTERLKDDPTTATFSDNDLRKFKNKALMVLEELERWVSYDTDKTDIGRKYAQEGIGLFRMHIPLCEGIRALVLLKRTLWLFVIYESSFETALELNQMRELNDRVLLFFDRATYYFIRGYLEEMNHRTKELCTLSEEAAREIFFDKSFYAKTSSP